MMEFDIAEAEPGGALGVLLSGQEPAAAVLVIEGRADRRLDLQRELEEQLPDRSAGLQG